MSLRVALKNLYGDREITGEALLVPFKRTNRFVQISLEGEGLFASAARLIGKAAVYLILGPLAFIGMVVKCLNAHQVKAYNDRIKQKIMNREIVRDYPNQLDLVYMRPIRETNNQDARNPVLNMLDQATEQWNRCACNVLKYKDNNEVYIQLIERFPRCKIPKGMIRPFET